MKTRWYIYPVLLRTKEFNVQLIVLSMTQSNVYTLFGYWNGIAISDYIDWDTLNAPLISTRLYNKHVHAFPISHKGLMSVLSDHWPNCCCGESKTLYQSGWGEQTMQLWPCSICLYTQTVMVNLINTVKSYVRFLSFLKNQWDFRIACWQQDHNGLYCT